MMSMTTLLSCSPHIVCCWPVCIDTIKWSLVLPSSPACRPLPPPHDLLAYVVSCFLCNFRCSLPPLHTIHTLNTNHRHLLTTPFYLELFVHQCRRVTASYLILQAHRRQVKPSPCTTLFPRAGHPGDCGRVHRQHVLTHCAKDSREEGHKVMVLQGGGG
jgi:hypothetical protein